MYSLTMVAPAFNEEELVEEFVEKSARDLSAVSNDWEIILVNDGSTDRTSEIAHSLQARYPQLKVIDLKTNLGNGANVEVGFRHATKDIVFNNTVDAFFNTEDLVWILPYLKTYDSISGCRTDLKANNVYQKLLTICNRTLIRTLFPLKLRAYQTVQFHPLSFFQQIRIEGRSSFVSPELLIKATALGYKIGEVEVKFHPRLKGTAKGGGLKHVRRSMKDIFKFWFKWVVLRRPIAIGKSRNVTLLNPRTTTEAGQLRSPLRSRRSVGAGLARAGLARARQLSPAAMCGS
jgi:glycosyltransferase involved in cell wall biosynthesis